MPTLDKNSYQMIPSLGQGEAIVTGNAMQVPVFVKNSFRVYYCFFDKSSEEIIFGNTE